MTEHSVDELILLLLVVFVIGFVGVIIYVICLAVCHKARQTPNRNLRIWLPELLQGRRRSQRILVDQEESIGDATVLDTTCSIERDKETENNFDDLKLRVKCETDNNSSENNDKMNDEQVFGFTRTEVKSVHFAVTK